MSYSIAFFQDDEKLANTYDPCKLTNTISRYAVRSILLILIIPLPVNFATMAAAEPSRSHQLLGTFFYPWFGHYNHWNLSGYEPPLSWASKYLPSVFDTNDSLRALYDSNDTAVILWQLGKMKRAGLDFAASSWWGRGSYDDRALRKIIFEVMPENGNPFHELKWSIVYEKVRFANPSVEEIIRDLQYLKATFGASSNILSINGKMVLFVAGTPTDQGEYVEKWSDTAKHVGGIFLVLRVYPGNSAVARKADAWYQFAPANRIQFDDYYWGYASPGYWMYNETAPRLSRNPNEFATALQRLRESNSHFALIETWNDWNEGTQIEPGTDMATGEHYGNLYVDLVRRIMKENTTPIVQPLALIGGVLVAIALILVILPAALHRRNSLNTFKRNCPSSQVAPSIGT